MPKRELTLDAMVNTLEQAADEWVDALLTRDELAPRIVRRCLPAPAVSVFDPRTAPLLPRRPASSDFNAWLLPYA